MTNVPLSHPLPPDHGARMERARLSLDGLSVGDAFGQRFFYPPSVESLIAERALPKPPWPYTDDTEMALAIVEVLHRRGRIDQDELASTFARRSSGTQLPKRSSAHWPSHFTLCSYPSLMWRTVAGCRRCHRVSESPPQRGRSPRFSSCPSPFSSGRPSH